MSNAEDHIKDTETETGEQPIQLATQAEAEEDLVPTLMTNVNDIDRMKVGAHLINVFNFAIIKQARRSTWNENDMRCFALALSAIDRIEAEDRPQADDDMLEHNIADMALRSTNRR